MSEADLELNEKYKEEERLAKIKQNDDGNDETSDEDEEQPEGNEDEGNGDEENDGGESDEQDIDDEMLGNVQPESTETTQA